MAEFKIVKRNYDRGFWTIKQVRDAVVKGWITKAQFKEITGKDYDGSSKAII
jgi:hypothetical protein